ncbi:MAG: glycine--tRNA ligase subunit beta [Pseudomonadota bacterium]
MKAEFLLEIGAEEIPAGFMEPACRALEELFTATLDNALIGHGPIRTYATPRRLILSALEVDRKQASREVEKVGPPKSQAYDENGVPTKAAVGFAKSQGVDPSELIVVTTSRGEQVAVRRTEEGKATPDYLASILPGLIERIPFPKTMRWMDLEVRFARPIHWLVALFDGEVIPIRYGNIESGRTSRGHRFTHPQGFDVASLADLRTELEAQGIVMDKEERREKIRELVHALGSSEGLEVLADDELLREVNFLVESPYPVMGRFHQEFLELPASILTTCMKKHQRYFAVLDAEGRITNRFIALNNTPVKDPAVSVKGHERVLKARLEDARFYFREDRKKPLIDRLDALKGVVFHSKLGTSFEKVQRFTFLAKKLAECYVPEREAEVERAALLCKCDLETGIVYEFPELQGIIGSFYARMDGESEDVCVAVREHYLPAYAGDRLPTNVLAGPLSIADRIDTIAGCFSVGLIPTGGADPYGLRRHALGIIQIVINLGKPLDLVWLVREAVAQVGEKRTRPEEEVVSDVVDFIRTRFVNFHTSRGYPLDVVEAAVRARFDDITDAFRRADALNRWKRGADFDAIIIGFKRVMNILKNTGQFVLEPALLTEKAEKDLLDAFLEVRDLASPLIQSGDYVKALEIVADLKGPIDRFFDGVMVMVEDERTRNNRLALLRTIADFFAQIADFSFIGSTA